MKQSRKSKEIEEISSDTDISEPTNLCEDESENSDYIGSESDKSSNEDSPLFTLSHEVPKASDFILVGLQEEKKKTVIEYVGQIIDINQDEKTYDVKYLRNYREHKDIFTFPEVDDQSLVYSSEVIGVLKNFTAMRHGKLRFFNT